MVLWEEKMSEKILNIENLRVTYETKDEIVHAVNGISFEIIKGQTLGIVGETGAGKTTTALSIMNLLPERTGKVKEGTIHFKNKSIIELDDNEMVDIRGNQISMIFQDPMTSLNPVKTVGFQIDEIFYLHTDWNREKIETKTDEMLELVGIPPERKNEFPHQFSGGMKQRVVIAMALACEPEVLIADEPTTALDVTIQAQVLKMMYELKTKLQTSMILITHDLGVVSQNCDTVAIMYAGEVVESGSVSDVFDGINHHPYTQGLFNTIPKLEDTAKRLIPISGSMPDPTNLPSGCKFHPRCPKVMDECKVDIPKTSYANKHGIKCHLAKTN